MNAALEPIDVWCPRCSAEPGVRCSDIVGFDGTRSGVAPHTRDRDGRKGHADRATLARLLNQGVLSRLAPELLTDELIRRLREAEADR
jgi:hypothetical protein